MQKKITKNEEREKKFTKRKEGKKITKNWQIEDLSKCLAFDVFCRIFRKFQRILYVLQIKKAHLFRILAMHFRNKR